MNNPNPLSKETPQETSDRVAKAYFRVKDEDSRRRIIGQLLIGTVEFVVYCLLAAVGLYFGPRAEYHSPVALRGGWADRIGAFWLVSCVGGVRYRVRLKAGSVNLYRVVSAAGAPCQLEGRGSAFECAP